MSNQFPLKSRLIETKLLKWKKFQIIQQEKFKDLSDEANEKLKASILANNFTQPFYVWQDPADAILDTTNKQDIVIDFFLGSGTCLMACEQTQRYCYAIEIKPKYVQSEIKRYLTHCAKKGIEVNFTHLNGTLTLENFKANE